MASKKRPAQKAVFSAEERAAMREHVAEQKARRGKSKAADASAVVEKIAGLPAAERAIATRLHAIVAASAPSLAPKLWYGMPAYANADGKVVCFFQSATKFNTRYSTFGFSDQAKLDDGRMWPTAFALTSLTAADEARITALVAQAAS